MRKRVRGGRPGVLRFRRASLADVDATQTGPFARMRRGGRA